MKRDIKNILWYGTVSDRNFLINSRHSYDLLAIGASTACYYLNPISKLLMSYFKKEQGRGFFIDPMTYAFQQNLNMLRNKKDKIKESMLKLMDMYDPTLRSSIEKGVPLTYDKFEDESFCHKFCDKVLQFQYDYTKAYVVNNDLMKYFAFAFGDNYLEDEFLRPEFLIPPYFYLDYSSPELFRLYLDLNISLLEYAKSKKSDLGNSPMYAEIVISKTVLFNKKALGELIDKYNNTEFDGILLWIDDFNEYEASVDELNCYIGMLYKLPKVPRYNLHGSYFSILAAHDDFSLLDGVAHGLQYGECRAVYPVGGGLPVSKYYFSPLHNRLDFFTSFSLLCASGYIDTTLDDWGDSSEYYKNVCDCDICRQHMQQHMVGFADFDSSEFYTTVTKSGKEIRHAKASPETKALCLYHYLECKNKEFKHVKEEDSTALILDLNTQYEFYSSLDVITRLHFTYLSNWSTVLNRYAEEVR